MSFYLFQEKGAGNILEMYPAPFTGFI